MNTILGPNKLPIGWFSANTIFYSDIMSFQFFSFLEGLGHLNAPFFFLMSVGSSRRYLPA